MTLLLTDDPILGAHPDPIQQRIFDLRGQRVILDADLAELYGVETKRLNEQVQRNIERFPEDFSFVLTPSEAQNLMSQFATSSSSRFRPLDPSQPAKTHGGRRKLPRAFTEHGAIMAASVLNSPEAVKVSVYVVRAFVHMRQSIVLQTELASRIADLEHRVGDHDASMNELFATLKELMCPPDDPPREPIGFRRTT